ncbi:MerR family transcriptional regulator [Sporofaciens sp. JLR.KK001]|uniref:MerR family transcriptional regulator n=1 Tax=Sporofaciens sp. JLR.KK001 TaxID=3112621 RepID=UPI002FF310C7
MYSAKEAAEITGLSTATLRYYEKEQLLPQIARNDQKYRQYAEEDIEWIKMIQCMRRAIYQFSPLRNMSHYWYKVEKPLNSVMLWYKTT